MNAPRTWRELQEELGDEVPAGLQDMAERVGMEPFVDSSGMVWTVHAEGTCLGEHCTIHNPSDHVMKNFPLVLRTDTFRLAFPERICPHGIGHPDPDHMEFVTRANPGKDMSYEGVHGCDGCCVEGMFDRIQSGAAREHHENRDLHQGT